MKKRVKSSGKIRKASEVRIKGERIPSFGDDLVLVRTGRFGGSRNSATQADEASFLVGKVGIALKRTGVRSKAVFASKRTRVFAYSADPNNPAKFIRRSRAGKTTAGRFVDGRFKAN